MLLLIVGIMVVVDLFVLFSDIMQLGELMIRDLSRYSTKMLNYYSSTKYNNVHSHFSCVITFQGCSISL